MSTAIAVVLIIWGIAGSELADDVDASIELTPLGTVILYFLLGPVIWTMWFLGELLGLAVLMKRKLRGA